MADLNEIRKQNLRKLINDYEGMNKLASELGLSRGAYLSQLLMEKPIRTISEKTARKWERKLELDEGWFDISHQPGISATPAIDANLLEKVILAMLEALENARVKLPAAQLAELLTMQCSDAFAIGHVDTDRIEKIARLLKRRP
jgi:hypothetical protein